MNNMVMLEVSWDRRVESVALDDADLNPGRRSCSEGGSHTSQHTRNRLPGRRACSGAGLFDTYL